VVSTMMEEELCSEDVMGETSMRSVRQVGFAQARIFDGQQTALLW